ncbi:hypothetical protein SAMN05216207_105819 [Pseudonocardia ammonioxydans]|uniref:Gluconate kinase n=1 Tax=Pseudonocardia ammonioxydans TaxID=260086 RepID=A0A1I5H6C8_PSUAM|nr:AAA family ATPase [Pseudonocardia ammonioxydans]SFO43814.1 hypothetical protein SAMN05216207_105819 [Pseudonocardia ammonioxydans]
MDDRPYAGAVETHSGVVFAVADHVYKAKKPVDLGFLDFRTLEQRREVCHREVELNRRLAPDVYLGVADVVGTDGAVCDHLVVMHRLPQERSLQALVDAGPAEESLHDRVGEVADVLARFHSGAQRSPEIDEQAGTAARRAQWRANLDGLRPFAGDPLDAQTLDEVQRRAYGFIEHRAPLFDRRIAEHRIVDGHGDLLANDVFCLADGPRLLDCVEFDDRLRFVDGLDDAAALVMDLHQQGHPELAQTFLRRYCERADDPAPEPLLDLFVAHRAAIRAKAACLRHEQGIDTDAAGQARALLDLSVTRLRQATPRMILVGGPPASGTTTLARAVAERIGAVVLSSDRVRKEIAGLDPDAQAPEGADLYSAEHTERTYAQLCRQAAHQTGHGASVVLDASWTRAAAREHAARVAQEAGADLIALRCVVDRETAAARAAERGSGRSDAGPEVARRLHDAADPWPEAHPIDTDSSPAHATEQALEVLQR